jgi:hypothetical protein
MTFARRWSGPALRVCPRRCSAEGDDWAGRACRPGVLVIDLRPMRTVEVNDGVAEVGSGATAADLVAAAASAGYAAATGAVGAVGVAGLTLGGGYGPLLGVAGLAHEQIAHAYGPNADRLLAVKASVDPENVFSAIPLPAMSPAAAVGEA